MAAPMGLSDVVKGMRWGGDAWADEPAASQSGETSPIELANANRIAAGIRHYSRGAYRRVPVLLFNDF